MLPPARPQASILRSVRLDEVQEALGAEVLFSRWVVCDVCVCVCVCVRARSRDCEHAPTWLARLSSRASSVRSTPPLLPFPPLRTPSTDTLDQEYSYIIPGAQRLADLLDVSHRDVTAPMTSPRP